MKEAIIYKIVNSKNKKIYVGSTTNFSRRKNQHFTSLNNNEHHSILLQRAYNKYGSDYFLIEKIESFLYDTVEEILCKEQYYIDKLIPSYNIAKIAGSQLGLKRSKKAKLNISNGQKGRKVWNKGLRTGPLSEEIKKNMSIAQKKRKPISKKTRKKISLSRIGMTFSNTHKENLSKAIMANPSMKGKKGKLNPVSKSIYQCDMDGKIINEFESISQSCEKMGFNYSAILNCLKKRWKQYKGFVFKYK